ncbi:helix-turn-helix domain-containing transcriptional regulator [Aeromonas hydrophila]|uniref:helix-turn-helix domain-containing transcriptional regulator n=1 Tax=Aeromonas hydrophila TaxID=644 RepID=UPI0038CF615E
MKEKFTRFDPADYLTSESAREAYLKAAIEEEDPCLLTIALRDIAKARDIEENKKAST